MICILGGGGRQKCPRRILDILAPKDGTDMPSRNAGNKLSIDAVQHSITFKTATAHCLSQGVTDAQFELVPPPGPWDDRNWEL